MSCVPYVSGNGSVPHCQGPDGPPCRDREGVFQAANYSQFGSVLSPKKHVDVIMRELVDHGPLDATFNVYSDFHEYAGGVYEHRSGKYLGLHSVKIIGYGVSNSSNVPYWLVQNSWGSSWGPDHGFFKIRRGSDECGFESLVYAGAPRL